jgi:uncharacterized membrane protein YphA (DoxX/SURF4 family)
MSFETATQPLINPPGLSRQLVTSSWRYKGIALLRIAFGMIWGIDAWLKGQPGFTENFVRDISAAMQGQPLAIHAWISFWLHIVQINPSLFAHLIVLGEAMIALLLVTGSFSNLTTICGIMLSLMVWTTAEGFGGPYSPVSTDIGAAIIYVPVFISLFLVSSGLAFGLDRRLTPLLGKWGFLASGSFQRGRKRG